MTQSEEILERIRKVFQSAMNTETPIDLDTEKDMVEEWDSINHLNLIVELESEFGASFSMEEIEGLHSVRQIVEKLNHQ